jgi:lysozyme family protein
MAEFEPICEWVLKFEDSTLSGKVVTLNDGAGQTRFGIASNDHPEVGGAGSCFYTCDAASALNLAKSWYRQWFWSSWMDQISDDATAAAIFDFSVNSGLRRAVKTVQGVLALGQDGVFGYHTLQAINQAAGGLAARIRTARAAWDAEVAQNHPGDEPYLKNWERRAAAIYPDGNGIF